jgi:hypothetical protein
MAELKTKPTRASVDKFLAGIDPKRRDDCMALRDIMQKITGDKPRMWGPSLVGFGSYHFKYASGREGDWLVTGFAPRKQNLTLYIMDGFARYDSLMKKLGKHTTGVSCLYIKRLDDVHLPTLKQLIKESVKHVSKTSTG